MNFTKSIMALDSIDTSDVSKIVDVIKNVTTAVFGLLTLGAVILAIILAYKFFTADTDDKRKNAKKQLIYAIIGIIVLVVILIVAPNLITFINSTTTGD